MPRQGNGDEGLHVERARRDRPDRVKAHRLVREVELQLEPRQEIQPEHPADDGGQARRGEVGDDGVERAELQRAHARAGDRHLLPHRLSPGAQPSDGRAVDCGRAEHLPQLRRDERGGGAAVDEEIDEPGLADVQGDDDVPGSGVSRHPDELSQGQSHRSFEFLPPRVRQSPRELLLFEQILGAHA